MNGITTSLFSIPRARLLRAAAAPRLHVLLPPALILFAAAIAAAILVDPRYILVALMILLIVAPMLLAFLYLSCLLSPRTVPNAYPHTLTLTGAAIHLRAAVPPLPDRSGKAGKKSSNEGNDAEIQEDHIPQETKIIELEIPLNDISHVRIGLKDLTIYLKGRPTGLLIIPYSAHPDPDALLRQLKNPINTI